MVLDFEKLKNKNATTRQLCFEQTKDPLETSSDSYSRCTFGENDCNRRHRFVNYTPPIYEPFLITRRLRSSVEILTMCWRDAMYASLRCTSSAMRNYTYSEILWRVIERMRYYYCVQNAAFSFMLRVTQKSGTRLDGWIFESGRMWRNKRRKREIKANAVLCDDDRIKTDVLCFGSEIHREAFISLSSCIAGVYCRPRTVSPTVDHLCTAQTTRVLCQGKKKNRLYKHLLTRHIHVGLCIYFFSVFYVFPERSPSRTRIWYSDGGLTSWSWTVNPVSRKPPYCRVRGSLHWEGPLLPPEHFELLNGET